MIYTTYIIDNILGMFTKARHVLMIFTHFECVHDIYTVCVCIYTSVREEFKYSDDMYIHTEFDT